MPPRGGKDRSVLADSIVNISEIDRNPSKQGLKGFSDSSHHMVPYIWF